MRPPDKPITQYGFRSGLLKSEGDSIHALIFLIQRYVDVSITIIDLGTPVSLTRGNLSISQCNQTS